MSHVSEQKIGGWALIQLWLFWLAPIIGATLAGVAHRLLTEERAAVDPAWAKTVTPEK